MDISISEFWQWAVAICAGIVTISKVWEMLRKNIGSADLRKAIDNDNRRIKALEEANALTMQALLALINHEIDGNNIEGMKKMRATITTYLTTRGA